MKRMMKCALIGVAAMLMSAVVHAQVSYSEDFEALDPTSATALGDSDWLGFATVFAEYPGCSTFVYNYGAPFPAPNGGPAFSSVVTGATGQAINVYNDYNNGDHNNGLCIEASVFQEVVATAADAGDYVFSFDTQVPEPPNDVLGPDVTTFGFIKLLDPNNNFNADIFLTVDTSSPGAKSIAFTLDATADGKILQWGFASTASNFEATGRWYDNVEVALQQTQPPVQPPVTPPSNVEGIPTLDQWGLMLMALLVAGLGLFAANRRF